MVRLLQFVGVRGGGALALAGMLCLTGAQAQAGGNVIRQLSLDESAPVVELFDGIDAGQFQVRMTALGPNEANVFIKNTTDAPLTVAVPKAVVGVNILPQVFGQQGNLFGNNQNQGQGQNQGQNQQGRSQTIGGPMQPFGNQQQGFPNNNNGNGNNVPGQGFFSIPSEKTVQLKLRTVCLDYGLPDPNSGLTYELRRLESEVKNPALCELLESYSPRVDQEAMQAAAWHLANNLSWQQILNLPDNDFSALAGGTMFSPGDVKLAQSLVKQAEEAAKDRPKADPAKAVATPKKVAVKSKKSR